MKIFIQLVMLPTIFLANLDAWGSREGLLALSHFSVMATGMSSIGKVKVEGDQDSSGRISSLTVEAFGNVITVPQATLTKLPHVARNGIALNFENSRTDVKGRRIILNLQRSFTSGTQDSTKLIVSESGEITIR